MNKGNEFFKEARKLMESGEMPDRVSNKLIWAAVSEIYQGQKSVKGVVTDIKWIKWAVRLIVTALVGLAFKVLV